LLKKGSKWHWSPELQKAFVKLKEQFANSTHLVQPDESLPYVINSDTSGMAIGGVLMQTDREGERHSVYGSDSQPGFRGTLGYCEHFLGVPRDVEIT
jgi:hypothetical protein